MKNIVFFSIFCFFAFSIGEIFAQQVTLIPSNDVWERPEIVPVPSSVEGLKNFKIDISDQWLVKNKLSGDIKADIASHSGWESIVKSNGRRRWDSPSERLFKQEITIPGSFDDKRIIIRFGGVAHAAKLYVNGNYVRDHWGSYMAWSADITEYISGSKAVIAVYTNEERTGLASFISGNGIHREVTLFAVPQNYIARANIETDLDSDYKDAVLRVKMKVKIHNPQQVGKLVLSLADKGGSKVTLNPSVFDVPKNEEDFYVESFVSNPLKWDAEHPNLYKLTACLLADGEKSQSVERNIGFREIERIGRQVFVNGQEVKFRGMWGGNDAKQLRDINVNHTRQKWATESFLDSCDYYGIYVLDENPVDFAKYGPEIDSQYAYQWLSLTSDLIERDYSHPSVVMWGLGNESFHGPNVLTAYRYAKKEDLQRQVMFSWSNRVKTNEELPFDIYSFHYPNVLFGPDEMRDYGASVWMANSLVKERKKDPQLPVICDEYAHVVLNAAEKERDPNVHNFWGESIKLFWDYMYNTPGALGGDQFGMFTSLNSKVEIPEVWLTRKAYSPIHLEKDYFNLPQKGEGLKIKMQNRFCHTNMNEITMKWKVGDKVGAMICPELAPAEFGTLSIPVGKVKTGDVVEMQFLRNDGFQLDEFTLTVDPQPFGLPGISDQSPEINESERYYTITGADFSIKVDKYQGLITSGVYKGKEIITYGPMLQFTGSNIELREWWCDNLSVSKEGAEAVIDIFGNYAGIWVKYEVRIDSKGLITTGYEIRRFPDPAPRFETLPWNGTHQGGFSEVGIAYELSADIDRLQWNRKALWTVYPPNHIGAAKGVAYKYADEIEGDWSTYTNDGIFFGSFSQRQIAPEETGFTNNFRGMKENIRTATALLEGNNIGIQVISPETDAVRMSKPEWRDHNGIFIITDNLWNYPQLGLGNYMKEPVIIQQGYKNKVMMRFYSE